MQRLRIVKGIGLIGLVAASLLLCLRPVFFQPAPKLYPRQAGGTCRRGLSRGIFVSSGWTADKFESWKAERTWWGNKFSAEEKDVLTHIYDRDFRGKLLGLLKQGGVQLDLGQLEQRLGRLRTKTRTGRT